ncbi:MULTISPECIES: hypothetical protein [Microbacterium]|uniref:hypothetical protein n=1 Tax=Microbacterium TaxID=33882 RepID=UPI0028EE5EED|nr:MULTISPECIES: hypothetical protein [Microbacterium]
MSDPYWPWWAVIVFFMSGAFSAWIMTISNRPKEVDCPNCDAHLRVSDLRAHWKVCMS